MQTAEYLETAHIRKSDVKYDQVERFGLVPLKRIASQSNVLSPKALTTQHIKQGLGYGTLVLDHQNAAKPDRRIPHDVRFFR